jgi:hypothetical protein
LSLASPAAAAATEPAAAADPAAKPNVDAAGVALGGYSPVSYLDRGKAEKGDPRFAAVHEGATYHLTSAAQVEKFNADPARYAPAYHGWCAYGMAIGKTFPIDPRSFKIVDGRLFLFLKEADVDALALWNKGDDQEQTKKADAHFKTVAGAEAR